MAKKDQTDKEPLARELYAEGYTLKQIAEEVEVTESAIKSWSSRKWKSDKKLQLSRKKVATNKKVANGKIKRKRGGQPGNQNSKEGMKGKRNAEKHGLFSKMLPKETMDIMNEIKVMDPTEILWQNIQIQYAAIIRAQKIMHVEDKQDKTEEIISQGKNGVSLEIQYAWDKQDKFLQAQSRAMTTLSAMLDKYEKLSLKSLDIEERKEKVNLLRAQILKTRGEEVDDSYEDDGFKNALKGTAILDWDEVEDEEEI